MITAKSNARRKPYPTLALYFFNALFELLLQLLLRTQQKLAGGSINLGYFVLRGMASKSDISLAMT